MRKIKFRAFSKDTNKMVYPDDIGIFKEAYVGINGRLQDVHLGLLIQSHHEGVVVAMQYTGLKDKNGKEIYEGDIVRHAADEGVYKVIFEDGGFYVKNLFEYDFQTINEYPLEVIGNIHEHSHLLKEGANA